MGDASGGQADLLADLAQLVQHLVRRSPGAERAQVRVERGHEARRHLVLGRPHGDPRRERRRPARRRCARRRAPRPARPRRHVDAGVEAEPGERGRERLARDRGGRSARPGRPRRRSGRRRRARPRARPPWRCRRRPGSRGRPAGRSSPSASPTSSCARCGWSELGRVVQEHARGAELGQLARLLDQRLGLVRVARAEDEPGVELLARAR